MSYQKKIMVLSVIRLKSEFMGYFYKIGIYFLGFMDALHNIGVNAIFIYMMLGPGSDNTVQTRMINNSEHTRTARNWVFNSPPPAFEVNDGQ